MSEINIGKRKEKCENCSKQQCSKKQSKEGPSSPQEKAVANGELSEPYQTQKVLLSSCLSCEGCLSEEESQRISQQNLEEFKTVLGLNKRCDASKHKVLVVSVCPQSLPFFAAKFCLGIPEATHKLCGFLKSLGVHHVFDTTLAAGFSILESQREFVQRFRRRHHDSHALPMFTSSCPGWIRYAERVLGSLVTPHICTAKSPQQIMGSLVKDFFTQQQKLTPDKVFHIVVAPCYDKKLEAVREEFFNSLLESRDVDCVLTSGEIFQMMEEQKVTIGNLDSVPLDHVFGEADGAGLVRHEGRGSEGFLEHIFKNAAKELFGFEVNEIVYKTLRNRDFQEVSLERDGETLLQFAAIYGFRNIQTLVHRMRKGRVRYQLVEVLSCPGGCLGGRGQAEGEGGRVDKVLAQQMEEAYSSLPVRLPEMNPELQRLYRDWLEGQDSPRTLQALHTQYSQQEQPHTLPPHIQW
ncbi:nuclear prelamin A recognition factor isoform X1 [Anguilla anguilla]|uniref:nuclear prelamin A recognition factor isoform X1 n=1 Tax=Anguilla anguilla TaxID=7936 RepID=UPI0015AF7555|nr:nuclear prelamin A recognition factor isoform X1 [Anguilla anguilla]XP_035261858.1 nuclear prelamin A recognition factor isoform X1 [Anguilla anguilla]XP_035261859.1 nuclear prelamin A recognition factor isoform X1 [Anguilla anguilla]